MFSFVVSLIFYRNNVILEEIGKVAKMQQKNEFKLNPRLYKLS